MILRLFGAVVAIFVLFASVVPSNVQGLNALSEKLRGRILLQVQQHGEAWYVKSDDGMRVFMGRPSDAFAMMRSLGRGVADRDIRAIPLADANLSGTDGDGDGLPDELENTFGTNPGDSDSDDDGYDDKTELLSGYDPLVRGVRIAHEEFARRHAGAIFLQVQQHGEAWYVNPVDLRRYYLGRPDDAFSLMRSLGLGISDADLERVPISATLHAFQNITAEFSKNQPVKQLEVTVVAPLPLPVCDGSFEDFKRTGRITCGRITWKLHPEHAALFAEDPRGYLMLYDRLYGTLKDLLAYEPKEKNMVIIEQCPPKGGASCPNGVMGWDYPMYVLGENIVYITSDFFQNYFWKLAQSPEHPISASIQHEMGHIFTASQENKYAYLWDNSFIEKLASVWGNMGAHMANELNNTGERYYWDAWCRAKGKPTETCFDSYATLDDWASLGSDADWKKFIANPKAVGNVHPHTLDMFVQLYRQFKNQGKFQDFYNGFRATWRYYNTEFSLPLAWKTYDIGQQSSEIVSAKASFFAFLLSYFTKTDLLPTFESWGYPIVQETKDAYARVASSGFDATVFANVVRDLTNPSIAYTGTGGGLTGSYYDDINFSLLAFTHTDPMINFDWSLNAPDARMGYDTFSIRWKGVVEAPLSGTYTFFTVGDDGVRLWVDGQKLIDDWTVHGPTEKSGTIVLEKGKKYDVTIEYYDEFYGASIQLLWTPPSKKKELIPQSQLYVQ